MALVTVKPTRIDTAVANEIAHNTNSGLEHAAQAMTWAPTSMSWLRSRQQDGSTPASGTRSSAPLPITS
nr:hypothetical protein [Bradyrhizobium yuanmingense]